MEETPLNLNKTPPVCSKCNKPLRYIGDKNIMDNMAKGLNASVTLADKSLLRLYVCETCRRVEFYMP